jgi:hypothetical protein
MRWAGTNRDSRTAWSGRARTAVSLVGIRVASACAAWVAAWEVVRATQVAGAAWVVRGARAVAVAVRDEVAEVAQARAVGCTHTTAERSQSQGHGWRRPHPARRLVGPTRQPAGMAAAGGAAAGALEALAHWRGL